MSERNKLSQNSESPVRKIRKYGDWFTNGMLGLGAILTAIPPTAPVGITILAGSSVDKAADKTLGKTIEEKYDEFMGRNSGKSFLFGKAPEAKSNSIPKRGSIYDSSKAA